jgi:hypothetical protein
MIPEKRIVLQVGSQKAFLMGETYSPLMVMQDTLPSIEIYIFCKNEYEEKT